MSQSRIFFSHVETFFSGLNQYKAMKIKCLAQGHKLAPLVRFEPATFLSFTCRLQYFLWRNIENYPRHYHLLVYLVLYPFVLHTYMYVCQVQSFEQKKG